jgi:hypothetical protein
MPTNDFEKHVQEELANFSLQPGDAVWQKVELRINKEKKRRRAFFFWIFAGIVLLGGGAGLYFQLKNEPAVAISNSSKQKGNQEISSSDNANKAAGIDTKVNPEKKINQPGGNLATSNEIRGKKSQVNKKPTDAEIANLGNKSELKNNLMVIRKDQPGVLPKQIRDHSKNKLENTRKANINETSTQPLKTTSNAQAPLATNKLTGNQIEQALRADTTMEKVASVDVPNTAEPVSSTPASPVPSKDSAAVVKATASKRLPTKKVWQFGLTAIVGLSDNVSGLHFGPSAKAYNIPLASSIGSAAFAPAIDALTFKSNAAFGIGLVAQKNISAKLGVSTGIEYQYFSTTSTVGTFTQSSRSFYDSVLHRNTTLDGFYNVGNNVRYTNTYHSLQMPVNIVWQINKLRSKPISLYTGITAGYLMGSNSLYSNASERIYYREESQFNRLQLSGQAGVMFSILANKKYDWQIGPFVQYQLNSLVKPVIDPNQHLLFTGLKTYYIIK